MAALANIYTKVMEKNERKASGLAPVDTARAQTPVTGVARLRAFANEDIYFYTKRIDNTGVVRAADPQSRRHDWKAIAGAGVVAVGVIGMLLGGAYGLLAGYKIDTLEKDLLKLETERGELQLESSKAMPMEKMNELAKKMFITDPALQRMVYLEHADDDDPQSPALASLQAPDQR